MDCLGLEEYECDNNAVCSIRRLHIHQSVFVYLCIFMKLCEFDNSAGGLLYKLVTQPSKWGGLKQTHKSNNICFRKSDVLTFEVIINTTVQHVLGK